MTDLASTPLSGPFRMTDALRRTFAVVFAEPWALFGLVFLIQLPSIVLTVGYTLTLRESVLNPEEMQAGFGYSCGQPLVSLVARFLAQAAVILIVFAQLRGNQASAWDSLRTGLARFLPLFGLSLLVALAVGVGIMLCLVPGLIVYTCTFVAVPVLLVEHAGVRRSWRRSFDLTEGYRWEVFGVVFVTWLIGFVFASLGGAVMMPALLSDPEGFITTFMVASMGLSIVAELVGTVLTAVAAAVVYHDLRMTKEGLEEDDLLAVFA